MTKLDYVKLDAYCVSTTDLSAAITNALTDGLGPSGGTIDATNVDSLQMTFQTSIEVKKPLTLILGAGAYKVAGSAPPETLFNIAASTTKVSFRLTGLDPTATSIKAAPQGTRIFQLSGNFNQTAGEGSPYFCVQRLKFDGNSASRTSILLSMISPPSPASLRFENGLLVVEDCLITNFGGAIVGAAIQIASSVYFCRLRRNQFLYNYQALYVDSNSETSIRENSFAQGEAGGATLTLVGPMNRVVHNYFYRKTLRDVSYEPDILLLPKASQLLPKNSPDDKDQIIGLNSQAGGYCWIEDNRFGGERENLDPRRTRIRLFSQLDARLIGGPVIVRGNQFSGPSAAIESLSANGFFATVTLKTNMTTRGLTPGTIVVIRGDHTKDFNGTFAIQTVIDDLSFTYALEYSGIPERDDATVRLASSESIDRLSFRPMVIISASSSGKLVTVTVARTVMLTLGRLVTINGAGDPKYNGAYVITGISSTEDNTTRFTYELPVSYTHDSVAGGFVYATNGAAITLMNPHLAWDVSGNHFVNYQTLINDYQTQDAGDGYGQSLFVDNRVFSSSKVPGYQVFANEGRNFSVLSLPSGTASPALTTLGALTAVPRGNETRSLQNRLIHSEELDVGQYWTRGGGLSVSRYEPEDPFGSYRAFRLALTGKFANQNIGQRIDVTVRPVVLGSRLVIKFWAKRDSLSVLRVGLWHIKSQQWHGNLFTASLGNDWQQYKFVTNGLVSTDDFALYFYPGDPMQLSGDVILFAPQVSDDDTDYCPTRHLPIYDLSGNRFEQAPVITSLKTMTNSGAPLDKPTSTWVPEVFPPGSNMPPGTASLEPGSSDFAGVIELMIGAGRPTSGTVAVSFAKAYVGASKPVVVACLVDKTGAWGNASVRVVPTQSPNAEFTLNWADSAGLAPGKTYGLSYIVIGRM
jgi:hypothetical protein